MEYSDVIKKLISLKESGKKNVEIERLVGIGKNSLSGILADPENPKKLSIRHWQRILDFQDEAILEAEINAKLKELLPVSERAKAVNSLSEFGIVVFDNKSNTVVEPLTDEWWKTLDRNKKSNVVYKEATESSYDGVKNPFPVSDEMPHFITPDPQKTFIENQISMHQTELDAIPDKNKGLGKLRAAFLQKQISLLKLKLK